MNRNKMLPVTCISGPTAHSFKNLFSLAQNYFGYLQVEELGRGAEWYLKDDLYCILVLLQNAIL